MSKYRVYCKKPRRSAARLAAREAVRLQELSALHESRSVRHRCRAVSAFLFLQATPEQASDVRWSLGRQAAPVRFGLENFREHFAQGIAFEGTPAAEHLIEHASE